MSLSKPFAALGFLLFAVSTWAAPQARIMRNLDSRQMTQLPGGVYPLAQPQFDQGALDPSQMLHHMTMFFSRTAAQQQALDQLLTEQQDPASSKYRQWLTPEEFAAQFGMAPSDLAKVQQWLVSQGFTIDEVARGGDFIAFSGSVGQVNSAFLTEMHQYNVNGELHFANAISPAVPSAMADVVQGFRGLNDFKPHARVTTHHVNPKLTSSLSGNHYMVPDDFQTIYDLKTVYNVLTDGSGHALDGTGQSIAIIGQVQIQTSDITTFRSLSGLPALNIVQASTAQQCTGAADNTFCIWSSGSPGNDSGDLGESDLDLEWAGATAPGANLIFVTAGDAFTAMADAVDQDVAPVISISYGNCEWAESNPQGGSTTQDENTLSKAASQGQTVVGPAGDDGAADCDYNTTGDIAVEGLYVDFPASSPYVTGVGGTSFNDATGTYWYGDNDLQNGSALSYIPEMVWNDTSSKVGFSATGGGASVLFTKPAWQTGTGVPSDNARDVPDVAFAASPEHDEYITCSAGSCQICVTTDGNCPTATSPGYRSSSDQTFNVVGGTSAGVPTFAGVAALLNQQAGTSLGLLNPTLYQLASSSAGSYVFHDITSGNNIVSCSPGTPTYAPVAQRCPTGGSFGYSAGTGYDQTTGLGSVDAYNLITNWSGVGAPDFAVTLFNSQAVNHGASRTYPLSVTALNGFSAPVSLSCSSTLPGLTCSVPATATPGSVVNVTLTAVSVISQDGHAPSPFVPYWQYSFGLAAFFVMGKKRSKRQIAAIAAVAVIFIIAMPSCGGGGGSSNSNVATSPDLLLNNSALVFNYQLTASNPAAQTISVSSTSGSLNYTVSTSTNSGGNWLSATSANTGTPGTISVTVNPAGLSTGTYSGTVTVSASGAGNSPQSTTVTLNVTSPTLVLNPQDVVFNYQIGGAAPAPQTVAVTSPTANATYTVSIAIPTGGNWLSATPNSGSVPGAETVSVDPTGLIVGTYDGSVTFTPPGGYSQSAPVILNVTATGTITVTATSGAITHTTQAVVTVN